MVHRTVMHWRLVGFMGNVFQVDGCRTHRHLHQWIGVSEKRDATSTRSWPRTPRFDEDVIERLEKTQLVPDKSLVK